MATPLRIFGTGGAIAGGSGLLAVLVAISMSVWRSRQSKLVTTYGSAHWAKATDIRKAGLDKPTDVFLGLYRDPTVSEVTSCCDWRIADLIASEHPVSLYLVVPPSDISRTKTNAPPSAFRKRSVRPSARALAGAPDGVASGNRAPAADAGRSDVAPT